MASWGVDLVSKVAESTTLDAIRSDFPERSEAGLDLAQASLHERVCDISFRVVYERVSPIIYLPHALKAYRTRINAPSLAG